VAKTSVEKPAQIADVTGLDSGDDVRAEVNSVNDKITYFLAGVLEFLGNDRATFRWP
jgi:hypothetical protein